MSNRFLAAPALVLLAATAPCQGLYDEGTVRTLELTFKQSNWWSLLTQNYASKTYIKADLKVGAISLKDVGVRFRGNSSYKAIGSSQKKPFKVSMDAFVPGQRLLGYRTLNLNNSFRDPTFTREVVSYWIFRQLMPASQANYVRLKINGLSWGPYINVEQINKDLLSEWFEDNDGNRYRGERQRGAGINDSALIWLGSNPSTYQRGYELKNSMAINPFADVRDLCQVLNQTAADKLPALLPKILDVDQALRYSVGQNVVPAIDSYIGKAAHNYYLYNDGYHGRFAILPWDLNATFGGNAWLSIQQKVRLDPFYQTSNVWRPMLRRTLAVPTWRERYLAYMRTMLDSTYDWKVLGPRIAALQKLIEPDLKADTKKLYSMQMFRDNVVRDLQIRVNFRWQWIPGLKPFVEGRSAFLRADAAIRKAAPKVTGAGHLPVQPTVKDKVFVVARVTSPVALGPVQAYWRVRGPWQVAAMADDGKNGDGAANDGVWGATLPAQPWGTRVEYYVGAETARTQGGAMTFAPRSGGHIPLSYRVSWPTKASPLRLNELLAKNTNGIRDEKGEREDWFEVYNSSRQQLGLGGMFLTDDLAVPRKWQIPAGTNLPAGQSLLFWADGELGDGPLHTPFKLDLDGECLALFDTDGQTQLDLIEWGQQVPDVSLGRLFDGGLPWVTYSVASTPGALNAPPACGYRHWGPRLPATHTITARGSGAPKIGAAVTWTFAGGPANSALLVLFGGSGTELPLPLGFSLLAGPPLLDILPVPTNAAGGATLKWTVPNDQGLIGLRLYCFGIGLDAAGWSASNAVETTFCKR